MKVSTVKPGRLIAYTRVSTDKQGFLGLGMDGQVTAIGSYVAATGCELIKTYAEVESGRKNNRPELIKALAHAKRLKAKLVIAKLDRLARNVHFVSGLMESGVDFVALDLPGADKRTIHIMAAIAEGEALDMSKRTKAGLDALRARGLFSKRLNRVVTLGAPQNLTEAQREKGSPLGVAVIKRKKAEAYAHIAPTIVTLKEDGLSLTAIAKRLNADGEETRTNKPWNAMQVSRVLKDAISGTQMRLA